MCSSTSRASAAPSRRPSRRLWNSSSVSAVDDEEEAEGPAETADDGDGRDIRYRRWCRAYDRTSADHFSSWLCRVFAFGCRVKKGGKWYSRGNSKGGAAIVVVVVVVPAAAVFGLGVVEEEEGGGKLGGDTDVVAVAAVRLEADVEAGFCILGSSLVCRGRVNAAGVWGLCVMLGILRAQT
ncbi:hypothetical protein DL770_003880 [Monosporascus sp. CRB-9-2]|nr:hypothetical protein DL770_003880 [Monosporascus sp. CRB-9-2]